MPTQADLALQAAGLLPGGPSGAAGTQADRALAAANAAPPPASSRSWMEQGGDFLSAFGHHAMNLPHGAAQLVENAASGVGNAIAPRSDLVRRLTSIVDADNKAMTDREAAYQAATPNSPGAYAGAVAGELAPMAAGGVMGGLKAAGDAVGSRVAALVPERLAGAAPMVGKMGSAATQGAMVGAASPVTDSDYWGGKARGVEFGAGLGAALPPLVSGLGGGIGAFVNAVRPLVAPKTVVAPVIDKMTGGNAALIEALKNPTQIVPGSMPTTAQIVATPEAVATEKAFGNTPAGKIALAERSNANNDARIAAVEGVAQTPDALAAAIKARRDTTQPLIDNLLTNGKPVDAAPVIEQLKTLQGSSLGTDPVVKRGAADLLASLQEGVANTGRGGNLIRPDLLDGYRQNVRSILQQYGSNGAVASKQEAAFEPVRSAIVDSIDGANPGYRDYLATYAKASAPIRTMEAAGSVLDGVAGDSRAANTGGVPQVTLTRYASALAKALKGPYDLDPQARATLEAVQSDLQRESISSGLRSAGSDTAYNVQAPGWLAGKLYGNNFAGPTAAAKVAGGIAGGVGGYLTGGGFGAAGGATAGAAALGRLGQFGQNRVNEVLSRALTDPQFAAELAQMGGQPQGQTLARLLQQVTPPALP